MSYWDLPNWWRAEKIDLKCVSNSSGSSSNDSTKYLLDFTVASNICRINHFYLVSLLYFGLLHIMCEARLTFHHGLPISIAVESTAEKGTPNFYYYFHILLNWPIFLKLIQIRPGSQKVNFENYSSTTLWARCHSLSPRHHHARNKQYSVQSLQSSVKSNALFYEYASPVTTANISNL